MAAAAASAGVEVLLVPSCTDDLHGYWRVRHCAAARAVETQSFVVLSSIVGGDRRYPEVAVHAGQGAVLSPCDVGFAERGIVAKGERDREGVCIAQLDLELLRHTRHDGTVLNLRDVRGGSGQPAIMVVEG